jgi:hypothetical protein
MTFDTDVNFSALPVSIGGFPTLAVGLGEHGWPHELWHFYQADLTDRHRRNPCFSLFLMGERSGEVRDPCRSADADQLLYWTLFGGNPSVWTGRWAKCVQGCSCCAKMYCIYIYMYIYTFIIHI